MRVFWTSLALTLGILLAGCGDDDNGETSDMGGDRGDTSQQPATCQSFCEAIVAAACDDSPDSANECTGFCEDALETDCADEMNVFLACAGQSPTIRCGESSGDPDVVGCGAQFDALEHCLDEPDDSEGCVALCEAIVVADCTTSPSSATVCPGLCTGIMSTTCADELESLIYCAGDDPVVTCNGAGDPTMDACTSDFTTYQECLEALEV